MANIFSTIFTSILFIGIGFYWFKYPPKNINNLYGYRTRRSMANQQIWDYANKIGAKMLLVLGVVTLVLGVFLVLVLPLMSIFLTIVLILIGLGVGMYWCETKLNRHFDKNGKPKE
ncbi:SdpI family protein [Cellulophaga tyrosinoxydans]|uniref:SdpI/YhfL protein family protein n=1 Tax=Cellulophaga tyrosinoxydans TaxID=504486 RepID=A0A1W1YMJ1_9FLAO|nr:SdpI family protein [Cellulophaga tyrosinoxydans]SMC36928.1 SdpI/YhfL protein family protein [Cellulophaga tyrosinoxydans]